MRVREQVLRQVLGTFDHRLAEQRQRAGELSIEAFRVRDDPEAQHSAREAVIQLEAWQDARDLVEGHLVEETTKKRLKAE